MDANDIPLFAGKKVRIYLKNQLFYTGYIKGARGDSLLLLDKYDSLVLIAFDSIERVREWTGD